MNFDLLNKYLKSDLKNLKINKYTNQLKGTSAIATHYINQQENLTYTRYKTRLNLFYNKEKFGHIRGQTPSTTSLSAKRIVNNKLETEKYLQKRNINCTKSISLTANDFEKGLKIVSKSDVNMVLKPINLNRGDGITLNVNIANYEFAWKQAKDAIEDRGQHFTVLLQPMIEGIEARFLVIENSFNSVILRVPANIVGDGEQTVKELIQEKNKNRAFSPHLKRIPIKINESLLYNINKKGYTLGSVIKNEEILYLHHSSNISLGGDSYEITHLISDNLKQLAESAVLAIPGINTAGVDILLESLDGNTGTVLEVNAGSNLNMHHYPWKGQPKSPVHDLIDTMLKDFLSKHNS